MCIQVWALKRRACCFSLSQLFWFLLSLLVSIIIFFLGVKQLVFSVSLFVFTDLFSD